MTRELKDIVQKIVKDSYGIEPHVIQPLRGEVDLNYKIIDACESRYVLKISRSHQEWNHLEFQSDLLSFLATKKQKIVTPKMYPNLSGKFISTTKAVDQKTRYVRLLSWIEGRTYEHVHPQTDDLRFNLGNYCGKLTKTLSDFTHQHATRCFQWDIAQSLWTQNHLHEVPPAKREAIKKMISRFQKIYSSYSRLRQSVVHNDAHQQNIIVNQNLKNPKIVSIVDFGDAIKTQVINDLAITCAYAITDQKDPIKASLPIVKGYHQQFKLQEVELNHLYHAIGMRLVLSLTKSAINRKLEPQNDYLFISEESVWNLLKKWININPEYAYYRFREACSYCPHPNSIAFLKWSHENKQSLNRLFPTIKFDGVHHIDLSVSSTLLARRYQPSSNEYFEQSIHKIQKANPKKLLAGGYLEPRTIYTTDSYLFQSNEGTQQRTMHLGIDFWLPSSTPVHALFNGEITFAINNQGDKEYGGLVVIKHQVRTIEFFTLYGHLSPNSILNHKKGDLISKGQLIGLLGNQHENGHWIPHLHFQIMLSILGYQNDFPGVAPANETIFWKSICPNPNALFQTDNLQPETHLQPKEIMQFREKHLGRNLSLSYHNPLHIVRGDGVYLIDSMGNQYLDTVNNVAHVGHENRYVVEAGQNQMALLNTNTRYLNQQIQIFIEELLKTLPNPLSVVYMTNSGSEANELALRMATMCTGGEHFLVSEGAYHGHTNKCLDLSPYKLNQSKYLKRPKETHVFSLPDTFRGKYRKKNATLEYINEIGSILESLKWRNQQVAGFIIESILSCAGQIVLPKGFLSKVVKLIRDAGGLYIADEIQVGCGRVGESFWEFQNHDVIPDILTIGKPIGNGHPIGITVCTQEIADQFGQDVEYFNTFGGNPVSCAIGTAVLKIIEKEQLQTNALKVGNFLKFEFQKLAMKYPIIGDIRGRGLFLGIELVNHQGQPLAKQANYLVEKMKAYKILMSLDGMDHNVLKIKPPLTFSIENAKKLLYSIELILNYDYMRIY
ncbi:MAG: aminotransferase class III-fold pyridoxal phosphate-dependent enzyme [Flavobacteriaceae bacterium]|nr:aminotransferase class III-fold pyridoxal phosphate-dependent enzyme [Flavobacteriaceae bacterium]MCY4266568.1 aminotransferase class III-fold pyridoxal phosphate-dependent enzyme [Flavobacteriaceae bacterium]